MLVSFAGIDPCADDLHDEDYLARTLKDTKSVIGHAYALGRPERLVLFSIGDELPAETLVRSNRLRPQTLDYQGKHLRVSGRTASQVAVARLIGAATDDELPATLRDLVTQS